MSSSPHYVAALLMLRTKETPYDDHDEVHACVLTKTERLNYESDIVILSPETQ